MDAVHGFNTLALTLFATLLVVASATSDTSVAIESLGDLQDKPVATHSLAQVPLQPQFSVAHWWGDVAGAHRVEDASRWHSRQPVSLLGELAAAESDQLSIKMQVLSGALAALLVCLSVILLKYAGDRMDSGFVLPTTQERKPTALKTAMWQVFIAAVAACTMAVDSVVAALVLPLIPDLCGGVGAPVLLFVRPIVAIATALVALPTWLRGGPQRGHTISGIGLVLLSLSCLCFASATTFQWAMLGQILNAGASASILVSVVHTGVQESAEEGAGLFLGAVLAGMGLGYGGGPWIGFQLQSICGVTGMLLVMAWISGFTCLLHLGSCWRGARKTADAATFGTSTLGNASMMADLQAIARIFLNRRRLLLLWGVGLGAAVLTLHSIAVPLYLQSLEVLGIAHVAAWQGAACCVLCFSFLGAGAAFDRFDEPWVIRGVIIALVLGLLGLRFLVMVPKELFVAVGLMASLAGIGMYLGLVLPLFVVRGSRVGYAAVGRKQSFIFDANASGMLGAFWFAGDAAGIGFQLLFYPLLGHMLTILAFACALALQAVAFALVPGLRRQIRGTRDAEVQL